MPWVVRRQEWVKTPRKGDSNLPPQVLVGNLHEEAEAARRKEAARMAAERAAAAEEAKRLKAEAAAKKKAKEEAEFAAFQAKIEAKRKKEIIK